MGTRQGQSRDPRPDRRARRLRDRRERAGDQGWRHAERFQDALRSNVSVSLFTLWSPLDIVTAREVARGDRELLGPPVAECWNELARHRD
jgi:hypothetical protein